MISKEKDIFQIKKNLTAIAIFILIVVVIVDIAIRYFPSITGSAESQNNIAVSGYYQSNADGKLWQMFTIVENNGDVYQCWNDGTQWNQKKATNYKKLTQR